MIRLLVVHDSAFMRAAISKMLEKEPDIKIVGSTHSQSLKMIGRLRPDVMTLDFETTDQNVLKVLRSILSEHSVRVVMTGALRMAGLHARVAPSPIAQARRAGALGIVSTPRAEGSLDLATLKTDLIQSIKFASEMDLESAAQPRRIGPKRHRATIHSLPSRTREQRLLQSTLASVHGRFREAQLMVIGISTGGPKALERLIPLLPEGFPIPVVIAQHMPAGFTLSMANRLDRLSPLRVVEAETGMHLQPGTVYVAPGHRHLQFRRAGRKVVVSTPTEPADSLFRPSVDLMFDSANAAFHGKVLALMMTGMGRDGLEGTRKIVQSGGFAMVQDSESCIVDSMPQSVADAGLADAVVPLDAMASAVVSAIGYRPTQITPRAA